MRVLFDHNVPRKLAPYLSGHQVTTARAMGWAELENGELLCAAESGGFDVMVTGDKNLPYQQNLAGRKLALIVLSTNNWNVIKQKTHAVMEIVHAIRPAEYRFIDL